MSDKYSTDKHEWGTDAGTKLAKDMTPGENKKMKRFKEFAKKVAEAKDQYVVMDRKTGKAVTKPMGMQQALDAYDGRGGNAKGLAVVKTTDKRLKEESELENRYKKGDKVKVRVRGGKIDDYVIVGLDKGVAPRNRGKFWTAQRNGVGTNRMINVKDIVEEFELDEATYKVDVEGLPVFYMDAASPEKVKTALRRLLRKASAIQDVDRVTSTTVRADYRDRIKNPNPDGDSSDD